jgi:hypothetical protein
MIFCLSRFITDNIFKKAFSAILRLIIDFDCVDYFSIR